MCAACEEKTKCVTMRVRIKNRLKDLIKQGVLRMLHSKKANEQPKLVSTDKVYFLEDKNRTGTRWKCVLCRMDWQLDAPSTTLSVSQI